MKRQTIKNRHELKLVIQVDESSDPKGLVFIEPGQGGFIEQEHIKAFADAFLENKFVVVRFDPTNSVGESGGDIENVTYTNYIEDLEDVIEWAKTQTWFRKSFAVCGHSMGAQAAAWYVENNPESISHLLPIAPVVNYEVYIPTLDPVYKRNWQEKGYVEMASRSKPGIIKKIGWGVNESLKNYDLLPKADVLTMPVLLLVGEFDQSCPYENQKILFDSIPSKDKKLIKIPDTEHSFRDNKTKQYDEKLKLVKEKISDWLKNLV